MTNRYRIHAPKRIGDGVVEIASFNTVEDARDYIAGLLRTHNSGRPVNYRIFDWETALYTK